MTEQLALVEHEGVVAVVDQQHDRFAHDTVFGRVVRALDPGRHVHGRCERLAERWVALPAGPHQECLVGVDVPAVLEDAVPRGPVDVVCVEWLAGQYVAEVEQHLALVRLVALTSRDDRAYSNLHFVHGFTS